jgi:hypothetical protein
MAPKIQSMTYHAKSNRAILLICQLQIEHPWSVNEFWYSKFGNQKVMWLLLYILKVSVLRGCFTLSIYTSTSTY